MARVACGRPTPRPCSSGLTPTATAPSPSRFARLSRGRRGGPRRGWGPQARARRGPGESDPGSGKRTRATRTRQRLWLLPGTASSGQARQDFQATRGPRVSSSQVRVWFGGREVVVVFPVFPGPCRLPLTFRSVQTPWILSLPCLHLLIHFNCSQMRPFKERESAQLQGPLFSYTGQNETHSVRILPRNWFRSAPQTSAT